MKTTMKTAAFAAAMCAAAAFADIPSDGETYEFDRMYAGASAAIVLPQGGRDMRRLGGATVRGGYYFTESLALEADASWLENAAGLGVQGLWHIYGYERFDPFLTFGARGWIEGDFGPSGGIGAFYHLTDSLSLRFDANAILGLDGSCGMVYGFAAGLQTSF